MSGRQDDRLCTLDGCTRPLRARGMCATHWSRWRKHGDPNLGAGVRRDPVCSIEGCERRHAGRGYCAMHLHRLHAHGDLGPVERTLAPAGSGSVMANGYRVVRRPGHPLAGAQHKVYEHRVVLFDAIGPGAHPCHWCGTSLRWEGRWPRDLDALTVDHLDEDQLNNERSNLVPACNTCNTQRNRKGAAA